MPDHSTSHEGRAERGRQAESPTQVPARGWKDILWRAWNETSADNIGIIAGGLTYYALLALVPTLVVLVSIYGLFSDPAEVQHQMQSMSGAIPGGAQEVIGGQLDRIAKTSGGALSIGVAFGFLVALYSASRGAAGLMEALNIAYNEKETRGFFRRLLVALALTLLLVVVGLVAVGLVAGVPTVVQAIGLGGAFKWLAYVVEWPLLLLVLMGTLAVVYRYAPARDEAQWRWLSPGAVVATVLWIVGSIAFTVYVANFGSYNKTYGSLGALIGMLTWMYLSSYVVLFGAEVNAEAERQTRKDTTEGPPKPMGKRGAHAADTVGERTDRH